MQKKTTFSAWLSTFVFCFLFWLLLTWSVHPLGLLMDAIFSAAVAAFTAKFFIHSKAFHFFNPARFFALIAYIFVFFWEMVKANLSMVGIVLSSKRNHCQSGIIRVPADKELKSEYGLAMVSNCITMTPVPSPWMWLRMKKATTITMYIGSMWRKWTVKKRATSSRVPWKNGSGGFGND